MKALIRNKGETVLESYNIPCINWNNGAPLTKEGWSGGTYILVEDYDPARDDPDEDFAEPEEQHPESYPDTIIIDGKQYTREELLALLNQTH